MNPYNLLSPEQQRCYVCGKRLPMSELLALAAEKPIVRREARSHCDTKDCRYGAYAMAEIASGARYV